MCTDLIPGDVPRLSVKLTDISGVLIDPTSISLTVRAPGALPIVYSPTRLDVGQYYVDYPVVTPGSYSYRWASVGVAQAAIENGFSVNPSVI